MWKLDIGNLHIFFYFLFVSAKFMQILKKKKRTAIPMIHTIEVNLDTVLLMPKTDGSWHMLSALVSLAHGTHTHTDEELGVDSCMDRKMEMWKLNLTIKTEKSSYLLLETEEVTKVSAIVPLNFPGETWQANMQVFSLRNHLTVIVLDFKANVIGKSDTLMPHYIWRTYPYSKRDRQSHQIVLLWKLKLLV